MQQRYAREPVSRSIARLSREDLARMRAVHRSLLKGKTWRYLRYLHAREALLMAGEVESVLVVGAGHGVAEVGLALEFPDVRFKLTDWDGATHATKTARTWVQEWSLSNVTFDQLDIQHPGSDEKFDMVYSVEVLEHIEDDMAAARGMHKLANRYIFCLVPFAEEVQNENKNRRESVLRRLGHHLVGYNIPRLMKLFPEPIAIRGVYWDDAGQVLRARMEGMHPEEIVGEMAALMQSAEADVKERIPASQKEAQGIWWLSRAQPVD